MKKDRMLILSPMDYLNLHMYTEVDRVGRFFFIRIQECTKCIKVKNIYLNLVLVN